MEQELRIADDVIALLERGGGTRAIVGGLRFGDALLPEIRRRASGTGVSVDAVPGIDDGPTDLLFRVLIEPTRSRRCTGRSLRAALTFVLAGTSAPAP